MATPMLQHTPAPTPTPIKAQLQASLVAILAQDIAKSRGSLAHDEPLSTLPLPEQKAMRQAARFAINPDTIAEDALVYLRRNLAQPMHGASFDKLHMDDRHEVADVALVAWQTLLDVLAGRVADIPNWEYRCLTFTGEYDPALLAAPTQTDVVQ
jgi:hypothetical protein